MTRGLAPISQGDSRKEVSNDAQHTLFVACALVVWCTSVAWGDDANHDALEGTWQPSAAELAGKKFPDEVRTTIRLEVKGDQDPVTAGTKPDRGTCKRNPSANPKALEITGTQGPNKGKTILAIDERNGDTLRICYDLSGKSRPAEFKTSTGTQLFLVESKLQKP
ncbi:MAG TPA: TIGR03067 domain-containing protein [Isosphaeraceae bacterium]|nr:TIGR03067 domain-containing protein [Isosphaeraceae bacterium]